ncbi:hypothetical protein B0T44_05630 [Nocardia donostiensis]|uniref:NADP-dependent oxidoreductase domain-containing protein n=2 Tax=Nocardia donostiensis TaxID=1538463 RepID=A0A1V2TKB5_9NOCA|nr:aldo/keto reductase [Nocardia donostiensis]ONM49908.1 hypothetical protein B0T46_05910 [Nocardia donostiensis]OQS13397.1 hypothetical protein B0T36_20065 [Nocardia donostiensis]OQS22142.1 hypothetical protein B0T44_05630 [Nocardia donostiensis]
MKIGDINQLGRSDVMVSAVGFDGAPISNFLRPFTDRQADQMVEQARDTGVRFFDTAPFYGNGPK